MPGRSLTVIAGGLLSATVACVSFASFAPGSAAELTITDAGVIHHWEFPVDFAPEQPPPPTLPAVCGPLTDYAGVEYAQPGQPLVAPKHNGEQSKGYILVGTDGDDVITGSNKNDCLVGLGGNDVLRGQNGKDILVGGLGADTLDARQGGPDELFGDESDTCLFGSEDRAIGCPVPAPESGDEPHPGKGKGSKGQSSEASTAQSDSAQEAVIPTAAEAPPSVDEADSAPSAVEPGVAAQDAGNP